MLQRLKRKVADWVYRPPPTYSINMLLPTNTETAWDGLGAKTRNMIRKHEKLGHTIYTKLDAFGSFYYLYSARMIYKSTTPKPYKLIEDLLKFSGNRVLYTEYDKNTLIGGAIIENGPYSANWLIGALTSEFLLWHIVKDCINQGKDTLCLGRSRAGSGTFKFKRHFCGDFALIERNDDRGKE